MINIEKIVAGCDHAGLELKLQLIEFLKKEGLKVEDLGTHSVESVDYPDFAKAVGKAVSNGDADFGLCVCGSGQGMAMSVNKIQGIRGALVYDIETAKLSRTHGDANVICFGQRLIKSRLAKKALKIFIETKFEGGRHQARVEKIG